jgi:hypothetical protein
MIIREACQYLRHMERAWITCVSKTWNECGLIGVNVGQAWYIMMSWMMSWIDKIRSLEDGVDL